jgi:hypothetical protein
MYSITKTFKPSKRTLAVGDYYGVLPRRGHNNYDLLHNDVFMNAVNHYFVQTPAITFGVLYREYSEHYNEYRYLQYCRTAFSFNGEKFYLPSFPNMFAFDVCVPHKPRDIVEFVNMFWKSLYGTQIDAVLGLLLWFGPDSFIKSVFLERLGEQCLTPGGNTASLISVNMLKSIANINDAVELTEVIYKALKRWEEISKDPQALERLQEIAELRGIPSFEFSQIFPNER